ncbi:MAG: ATP phosphoribosyltransferase regulatory subunit [Clostridia bacterium]|nr:ATP phosphoribosyltransferase regulatory subunit [Clostridia bacterium]
MQDSTSFVCNEEKYIISFQHLCEQYGYKKFRMSKFEDYDLYLENKNFLKSGNIITFNGPSGRLLALKPDITLSIVKNARDALTPHRVYYSEKVYRASDDANDIREITQAGVEFIGDVDIYAMSEVLLLAQKSLKLVCDDYIIGISHTALISGLLNAAGLSLSVCEKIHSLIKNKNAHEIRKVCADENVSSVLTEKIASLACIFGNFSDTLPLLSELCIDEQTTKAVEELKSIYSLLLETGYADRLCIDFSVTNDMDYYNGITFQGFIRSIPQSVLSGGRYDNLLRKFSRQSDAVGFAVYIDLIERYSKSEKTLTADVAVIYDKNDMSGLSSAVSKLIDDGNSVRVQTCISPDEQYGKIYKFSEGRLVNND